MVKHVDDLFAEEFLVERPLLAALRAGEGAVLLVDELDRADDEFEAFLLEVLSEFAVTIPEVGRIAAVRPPAVIITSNRTRELHDALKRRCLYHWIDHPTLEREIEIISVRAPEVPAALARQVAAAVARLRVWTSRSGPASPRRSTGRTPWSSSGSNDLDGDVGRRHAGAVLKDHDDLEMARPSIAEVARAGRHARVERAAWRRWRRPTRDTTADPRPAGRVRPVPPRARHGGRDGPDPDVLPGGGGARSVRSRTSSTRRRARHSCRGPRTSRSSTRCSTGTSAPGSGRRSRRPRTSARCGAGTTTDRRGAAAEPELEVTSAQSSASWSPAARRRGDRRGGRDPDRGEPDRGPAEEGLREADAGRTPGDAAVGPPARDGGAAPAVPAVPAVAARRAVRHATDAQAIAADRGRTVRAGLARPADPAAAAGAPARRAAARWRRTAGRSWSSRTRPPPAGRRVEVFVFGTRLTRITRLIRSRDPDAALDAIGRRGRGLGGRHADRGVAQAAPGRVVGALRAAGKRRDPGVGRPGARRPGGAGRADRPAVATGAPAGVDQPAEGVAPLRAAGAGDGGGAAAHRHVPARAQPGEPGGAGGHRFGG